MKKLLSIIALTVVCSSSLLAQDKVATEKICITEQEYQVYEAAGVGNFQNETTPMPTSDWLISEFKDLSPSVLADFSKQNNKAYLLRCVLKRDQKKKKLKTYNFTSSTLSFSRIGFNDGETEALVYVSWSGIGNTCGADFILLKKENNKWSTVKKVMTVIC
jgi:hypothetical protein